MRVQAAMQFISSRLICLGFKFNTEQIRISDSIISLIAHLIVLVDYKWFHIILTVFKSQYKDFLKLYWNRPKWDYNLVQYVTSTNKYININTFKYDSQINYPVFLLLYNNTQNV